MESLRLIPKITWIILGALALSLRFLGSTRPDLVETYYSRGLFKGVRWLYDVPFSWVPFPIMYAFLLILVIYLISRSYNFFKRKEPWKRKTIRAILSTLSFVSWALFFFFFLWGYNYQRLSVEKQMNLKLKPLSVDEMRSELEFETNRLISLRKAIRGADENALKYNYEPQQLLNQIRKDQAVVLERFGFDAFNGVRGRFLQPKGVFLHFSSLGMYFPYAGEGNVDSGVHPLQAPSVLAHELAHAQGFGDEGTCNFWAFLTCRESKDPIIAYAGQLAYWRTLAVNYLRFEPEKYQNFRYRLPQGIVSDLDAINLEMQKYPDLMPKLRTHVYDSYLKSQGIHEGIINYNRVLMLVKAYKETIKDQ